jgi:hypothetical protein
VFYVYSHTPTEILTEATATKVDLELTAGIIHQVDVLFQDGCNHETFVQIFDDNFQVWPSNRGEKLRGNATVVSFREFYELATADAILTAYIWSTLTADWKEVIIQIGLLPKRIIQPMSFEELLAAAAGIE